MRGISRIISSPPSWGEVCALFDYDRDGRLDVYLVNGNEQFGARAKDSVPIAKNRLYRQTEDGRFVDVTEESGLGDSGFGMGVAVGDVNNDGYPDVYVTNVEADRLFLNQRDGAFRDVTDAAGIENLHWSASATFVDFDRDGWLDLYVTNYLDYYPERKCPDSSGQLDFCGPQTFFPVADKLFRNMSGRAAEFREPESAPGVRFQDVSLSSKIAGQSGAGLGVVCADFNDDCWPDIYVANDRMANFLWINQRDGTFVDEAVLRGAAFDSQGRPQASMGIALGDINGDSKMDVYVTHLEGESNALYRSTQEGVFNECSVQVGILAPTFPYTGFGTAFVDVDQNGFLDILVVNGRVKRSGMAKRPAAPAWSRYAEKNLIFLHRGDNRFIQADLEEPFCYRESVSRGLATGDIDNDGDLDLLVTNLAEKARLYRNDAPKSGEWLQIQAVDRKRGGRAALGAVVTMVAGNSRCTATIQSGTSYLSACQPIAHFGLRNGMKRYDRIEVIWPDGTAENFEGGPVAKKRLLEQGTGKQIDGPTAK